MVDLTNPLSWPLFPILPVVRIGGNPIDNFNDTGIVGAIAKTCQPVAVVFICNLCHVGDRSLASLFEEPTIRRETFPNMAALAKVWQPD